MQVTASGVSCTLANSSLVIIDGLISVSLLTSRRISEANIIAAIVFIAPLYLTNSISFWRGGLDRQVL